MSPSVTPSLGRNRVDPAAVPKTSVMTVGRLRQRLSGAITPRKKKKRQYVLVLSHKQTHTQDLSNNACPLAKRHKRPLDTQALTLQRQKLTEPSSVIKKSEHMTITECHFLKTASSCQPSTFCCASILQTVFCLA